MVDKTQLASRTTRRFNSRLSAERLRVLCIPKVVMARLISPHHLIAYLIADQD
jgi:hypothetical protein